MWEKLKKKSRFIFESKKNSGNFQAGSGSVFSEAGLRSKWPGSTALVYLEDVYTLEKHVLELLLPPPAVLRVVLLLKPLLLLQYLYICIFRNKPELVGKLQIGYKSIMQTDEPVRE